MVEYTQVSPESFFWVHTIGTFFWSFLAPFQLSQTIRSKYPTFHHLIGYTVFLASFFLTFSGILFYPVTGKGMTSTPSILNTIWVGFWFFYTTCKAVAYARQKNFPEHKNWMIRHLAIGAGVGAVRIVNMVLLGIFTLSYSNFLIRNFTPEVFPQISKNGTDAL